MKILQLLTLFTTVLFITGTTAQNPKWINCLSGDNVNDQKSIDTKLWIATNGGLVVYDPMQNSNAYFTRANSILPSNRVMQIEHDASDVVWVLTDLGLVSLDEGVWILHPEEVSRITLDGNENLYAANPINLLRWTGGEFEEALLSNVNWNQDVLDMNIQSTSGDIWVAVLEGFSSLAVHQISGGTSTVNTSNNSILPWSAAGLHLSMDEEGDPWLLTSGRLYTFENEWKDVSALHTELNEKWFSCFTIDGEGSIHLVDESGIIILNKDGSITEMDYPMEIRTTVIPKFIDLAEDIVFMGFGNQGLWKYEDDKWLKIETSEVSFRYNHITVSKDLNEQVYIHTGTMRRPSFDIGLSDNQVYTYANGNFEDRSEEDPYDEALNYTLELMGDEMHGNWMLMDSSLYEKVNEEWVIADMPEVSPDLNEQNSTIFFDHNGDRWLALQDTSVILYESADGWVEFGADEHLERWGRFNTMFNHPVTNDLWLSSHIQLSVYNYDSQTWTNTSHFDLDLNSNNLRTVVSRNGEVYGISNSEFFKVISQDEVEVLYTVDSFFQPDNSFRSIYTEGDNIWLGLNGLLIKYSDGDVEQFDSYNTGVPQSAVNSVVKDENGNYWIGSNNDGLAIYNPDGVSDDILNKGGVSNVADIVEAQINVYPNPTSSQINIDLKNSNNFGYRLFDAQGQQVLLGKGKSGQHSIDLGELSSGLYHLIIEDSGLKTRYNFQIVVSSESDR